MFLRWSIQLRQSGLKISSRRVPPRWKTRSFLIAAGEPRPPNPTDSRTNKGLCMRKLRLSWLLVIGLTLTVAAQANGAAFCGALSPQRKICMLVEGHLGDHEVGGVTWENPEGKPLAFNPIGRLFGNWRVGTLTDQMTDRVTIVLNSEPVLVITVLWSGTGEPLLLVRSHDFPGREFEVRVDDGPVWTSVDGHLGLSKARIEKLSLGKRLRASYYRWPDDYRQIVEVELSGFGPAINRTLAWTSAHPEVFSTPVIRLPR
jgi:hypothetical protein